METAFGGHITPELARRVRGAAQSVVAARLAGAAPRSGRLAEVVEVADDLLASESADDLEDRVGDYVSRCESWGAWFGRLGSVSPSGELPTRTFGEVAHELGSALSQMDGIAQGIAFMSPPRPESPEEEPFSQWRTLLYSQLLPPDVRLAMCEVTEACIAVHAVRRAQTRGEPLNVAVAERLAEYVRGGAVAMASLHRLLAELQQ